MVRRSVFGVLMSIIFGGVCLSIVFPEGYGFVITVYAIPFILLYGIPISVMAHKLTSHEKRFAKLKRLVIYVVISGWLYALISLIYFAQGQYESDPWTFVIILSMFFALCFWLGEEIFERTKLKEWTEPDLTKV